MSESKASKWNARYEFSGAGVPAPAEVLSRGQRWLPNANQGSSNDDKQPLYALDLACGRAGNAQFLAQLGFEVSAWDISDAVINELKSRQPFTLKEALVRDVSASPPPESTFDVVVVSRFLDRALCPAIASSLKPQGVLFYQTFVHGLNNPDYLLAPNELFTLFQGLHINEYHEPEKDSAGKAEARLIATRRT